MPGADLVAARSPDRAFCIDATEVTNETYAQFLAAGPPDQIPECAWNTTFEPEIWPAPSDGTHPVERVDWCDAQAFCHWAGKRLCQGVDGGPVTWESTSGPFPDVSEGSEWSLACTANGKYPNFYEGDLNGPTCQSGFGKKETIAVGSKSACSSADPEYEGLSDMIGNVAEWEDACSPGSSGQSAEFDFCLTRGGSYADGGSLNCASASLAQRQQKDAGFGIRCCVDGV